MDAVQRGLLEISEFVPDFAAGHAGRMEVYTYGPAGDEPRIVSYDFGVHEIDGADVSEWVDEGVSIVISITRRRRVETSNDGSCLSRRNQGPSHLRTHLRPQCFDLLLDEDPAKASLLRPQIRHRQYPQSIFAHVCEPTDASYASTPLNVTIVWESVCAIERP